MNLILDVGNSFLKLAVFNNGNLLEKWTCVLEDFGLNIIKAKESYPNIEFAIVSKVGMFSEENIQLLTNEVIIHVLSYSSNLPFTNLYATPKTLGVDRMALVSAAAVQYPKKNVLVIDAGSCITYDFINDKNQYLGGAISPGLAMRYKAMHTFTAKLPLLETTKPKTFIGDTTKASMDAGVVQGVANEIEGFITLYQKDFSDLTTILTGGDTHFLLDSIKNDIFANSNFLLEGLNHILEINKNSF